MGGRLRIGVVGPKRGTWWGVRRKLTARLEAMLDRWVSRWWGYEGRMDCFLESMPMIGGWVGPTSSTICSNNSGNIWRMDIYPSHCLVVTTVRLNTIQAITTSSTRRIQEWVHHRLEFQMSRHFTYLSQSESTQESITCCLLNTADTSL